MASTQQLLASYGSSFVGPLDGFEAGLTLANHAKRRLLTSYTGPLFQVRADRTGQPTFDVPYKADGSWDKAALMSFAGLDTTYFVKYFAQYGSITLEQPDESLQPVIATGGVLNENGGFINNDGRKWTAPLNDILDLVGDDQAQFYSDFLPTSFSGNAQDMLTGPSGMVGYLNYFGSNTMYFDWLSGQRVSGAVPAGMLDTPSTMSLEHDADASRIRINGTVAVSGATSGSMPSSGPFDFSIPGIGNLTGYVSSYIVWNTCNPTLAAERVAALA